VDERGGSVTRLDAFIQTHDIEPEELARLAKVSGAYLVRLRAGRSEPSKAVMVRLAKACAWITCEAVYSWDLFDRV